MTARVLEFPSPRPRLVCSNCGEPKDDRRAKTCVTYESDANPTGSMPVYGIHEDIEESK